MARGNMYFKHRMLAVVISGTFISGSALARPLEEELRQLSTEHPLIKSARKSVESSDYGRDVARAGFLPKLSISGDTGKEKISSTSHQAVNNKIDSSSKSLLPQKSDLNREKFVTLIEQNLFSGGRTMALVGIAEIDFAAQENAFRSTMQNVLLEGITAYLQVGRYKTLIAIAARNEATTQKQLNLEDERVKRGGGIAVDVLQAKTRLQIAKERRVFQEQNLRDAVAQYRQVFGHAPDLDKIQDLDILTGQLPTSLEEALEVSQELNPSLKEAVLQSQKAMKQIGTERAGFMPSIDLVGLQSNDKNANQLAEREETSLLVKMNWNLFAGGETIGRYRASAANHESLVEREINVARKVEEAVRIAWNQLVNGRERQDLLANAADISFEVMHNRQRLRDAGKETAINVLDSEVEYYGVQANRFNAIYDTRIGSYRLLAAMGQLTPKLVGMEEAKIALPVKPFEVKFDVK